MPVSYPNRNPAVQMKKPKKYARKAPSLVPGKPIAYARRKKSTGEHADIAE
jgi:hypothetical protein